MNLLAIIFILAGPHPTADGQPLGYVTPQKPAYSALQKYHPREGDLIFYDDRSWLWTPLFLWAGTGPPLHVGMVVKNDRGKLSVLEAGPDDTVWVRLLDLETRLPQFQKDYQGTITIRRCKKELTSEQSAQLTKFAFAQDGKRYAVGRLLLQGTMFRNRGPFREQFLARTDLDRDSWICSELVVAAGTLVDLFPPSVKSNVTYPLDIVNNRRHDLSRIWHAPETWLPPSRSARKDP